MTDEHKLAMRRKARVIRGIVTILQDDADYMCVDAEGFDLISLSESIREAKDTMELLQDHITELEWLLCSTIGGN